MWVFSVIWMFAHRPLLQDAVQPNLLPPPTEKVKKLMVQGYYPPILQNQTGKKKEQEMETGAGVGI